MDAGASKERSIHRWTGCGLALLIASLCVTPVFLANYGTKHIGWVLSGAAIALLASAWVLNRGFRLLAQESPDDQYEVCAAGLAMWCLALALSVGLVVLAEIRDGDLPYVAAAKRAAEISPEELGARTNNILQISGLVAALGASMFCLRRIRRFRPTRYRDEGSATAKQPPEGKKAKTATQTPEPGSPPKPEAFQVTAFWSGLVSRTAQAEIYTLILFLWAWGAASQIDKSNVERHAPYDHYWHLPIVALMVGLFITTFETVVAGAAERLASAAEALVGKKPPTTPGGGAPTSTDSSAAPTAPPGAPKKNKP